MVNKVKADDTNIQISHALNKISIEIKNRLKIGGISCKRNEKLDLGQFQNYFTICILMPIWGIITRTGKMMSHSLGLYVHA